MAIFNIVLLHGGHFGNMPIRHFSGQFGSTSFCKYYVFRNIHANFYNSNTIRRS